MSSNEKLENYFGIIVEAIDDKQVIEEQYEAAKKLPVPLVYLDVYQLKYYCEDWRTTAFICKEWQKKLYDFADSLLRLEDPF